MRSCWRACVSSVSGGAVPADSSVAAPSAVVTSPPAPGVEAVPGAVRRSAWAADAAGEAAPAPAGAVPAVAPAAACADRAADGRDAGRRAAEARPPDPPGWVPAGARARRNPVLMLPDFSPLLSIGPALP